VPRRGRAEAAPTADNEGVNPGRFGPRLASGAAPVGVLEHQSRAV
jgi:hypothetical protein